MPVLGIFRATLNNKEQAPQEFWLTFFSGLPPFLNIKKFGKITASFSQTSLKADASFKNKIRSIPDYTLSHDRHKNLRANLLWVMRKKSFACMIFGKIYKVACTINCAVKLICFKLIISSNSKIFQIFLRCF